MFDARVKRLKKNIKSQKLDGTFISSVSTISYLTGYSNFSKDEREAYLLIGEDFQYIITDGRYSEAIQEQVPHFELFERTPHKPADYLLKKLKNKINILGIEENDLTVSEHKLLKKHFKNLKHFNLSRSIKEKEELEKIEKAAKLGDEAFKFVLTKIKEGVTEKEIAFEIEMFIKRNGASISFPSIVAFGKNSSVPHHQTSDKRLMINDNLILLDFGVRVDNYCSDMTRTVFFGKSSDKQKKIYETVLKAQQKAVEFINLAIKSGKKIKAKDVDKAAREYITSKNYPTIPHSLGHGVGLEVHEHPSLSTKSKEQLKMGMVFSIEPGIYIPDFGGVRIEDLYVLENRGLRQLTNSPKNIIQL